MIRKKDWDAAADAERLERISALGTPPSADEVLAFFDGDLPPAEMARVREWLIYEPELAQIATAPFPADDDPALLSDGEFAADWEKVSKRVGAVRPPASSTPLWRSLAIAATIVIGVLGILLFNAIAREKELSAELHRPRPNVDTYVLLPDGHRGGLHENPIELPPLTGDIVLVASLIDVPRQQSYKVEIFSAGPQTHSVWSTRDVRRRSDDTVSILIPSTFLGPGTYSLVVSGDAERLATYSFRVPARL